MACEEKLETLRQQQKRSWGLNNPPPFVTLGIELTVIVVGILEILLGWHKFFEHGMSGLLKFLGVVAALALWILCFRIFTARISTIIQESKIPKYSRRIRRCALVILIVISTIPIGIYVATLIPPKEFLILVADFDGPHPENYRVTDILLLELRRVFQNERNIRIGTLDESITEKLGSKRAREVGAGRYASMVLWGWYAVNESKEENHEHSSQVLDQGALVTVHVEIIRGSRLFEHKAKSFNTALSELTTFKTQFELGREMSSLAMLVKGTQELGTGDFNSSIAHLTTAISQESRPDELVSREVPYMLRARAYFNASQLDNALDDYNRALALNPAMSAAWNNLCAIHAIKMKWTEALNECTRAIQIEDSCCRAAAYANRGRVRDAQGQLPLAIEDYNRAIAIKPQLDIAYNLRGEAYRKLGQSSLALDDFNHAIKLTNDYPTPYNNRGIVFAENLRDYKQAINDFNQAIEYRPNYPEAYNNRGATYGYIGNATQAIADYQKAIEIEPDYFQAHKNLGRKYADIGDLGAAINETRTAVALTNDWQEKAELMSFLERLETADRAIHKSHRSFPKLQ